MAAQIDFNEIATIYNGGDPANDAKLTQITLKARDLIWTPSHIMTESVRIERKTASNQPGPSASTEQTMRDNAKVQIDLGLCKGLNTTVKMPYPGGSNRTLSIDPCNAVSEIQPYPTDMEFTSKSQNQRTQRVQAVVKTEDYQGTFQCNVYPGGKVLTERRSGSERYYVDIKTQTVIAELKDQGHHAVRNFKENEHGEFYFTMGGRCRLHHDAQMQHNWQ